MSKAPRVDIVNISFLDWSGTKLYTGGAERYVRDLGRLCMRMGLSPRIVQNAKVAFCTMRGGLEIVGIPAATSVDFGRLSAGMAEAVGDADLVIASPLELACRMQCKAPIIGINHGIWWDDPNAVAQGDVSAGEVIAAALANTRCTVAVDTNFINWVRAEHVNHLSPLTYIPNYVALDSFVSVPKSFSGRLRVLFPRRLCIERGFPVLLAAFENLFARRDDLELCICGSGTPENEALSRAFVARHTGRSQWIQKDMDSMPDVYSKCHIVVIPTVYGEGTSLSCLEAMATNNAVIATSVGGLPNLVLDGYNGLLIDTGAEALVAAVTRLAEDRALATQFARRASDVAATFGRSRWEQAWTRVIVETLDARVRSVLPELQRMLAGPVGDHVALEAYRGAPAGLLDDVATGREATQRLLASLERQLDAVHAQLTVAQERADVAKRLADERDLKLGAELAAAAADLKTIRTLRDAAERDAEGGRHLVRDLATELDAVRADRTRALSELGGARLRLDDLSARYDAAESAVSRVQESLRIQAVEHGELDREIGRHKAALAATAVQQAEDAVRESALREHISALENVVVARDAGIVWLRGELRTALSGFRKRRLSLKLLGIDALYALNERLPLIRSLARAILPDRLRSRVYRHSFENSVTPQFNSSVSEEASAAPARLGDSADLTLLDPKNVTSSEVSASADAKYDVLCFAVIEWGARFQRPQHLMNRFAAAGHRVFYIVASKLPPEGAPYSITCVAPGVFEVGLAVDRAQDFYALAPTAANLAVMQGALAKLTADRKINTAVSLVQLPFWTPLALGLRNTRGWLVTYDCMDEWEDFPNIGTPLLAQERALVEDADLVTVTADLLAAKWSARAHKCVTVRNGVDFEFFSRHCAPNVQLNNARRPVIGYYGALAEWVDFELLADVARARPDWTLVLVGDVFVKDLAGLDSRPNVLMPGRRPYAEMPAYLYHFDVCLIPFKLNDVTHAVDPVKFYEYLSVGKPVVSVPLEEMKIYHDFAYFATGGEEFVSQIEVALGESTPQAWHARTELAKANDWRDRHARMAEAIRGVHLKISIVIVSFNNAAMTRGCVESIYRNTAWPNFEVIVVDNASTDETRAWLRYLVRTRNNASVIFNDQNRGFAAANNQGLASASGDIFVLLNNDTVVPPGWLAPLLDQLEDPTVGMVGPVTNFVGNEAKIPVQYAAIDDMEGFAVDWMEGHRGHAFDIRMLAMFCVAFRREVYERIGILDESFGIGMFEDDDYSRRIQFVGLRTVCTPASFVHHFGQASFRKLIENGEYDTLWQRNKMLYEGKWGEWKPHSNKRHGAAQSLDAD